MYVHKSKISILDKHHLDYISSFSSVLYNLNRYISYLWKQTCIEVDKHTTQAYHYTYKFHCADARPYLGRTAYEEMMSIY